VGLQKIKLQKQGVIILAFYQIIGASILACCLSLTTHAHSHLELHPIAVPALIFCGIVATSVVLILQTRYQQYVPATQAVLIYALELVFAGIFSFLIVGEHFTWRLVVGGTVIFFSILLNEFAAKFLNIYYNKN